MADQFLTIPEFCRDHKISRAFFYKLERGNNGPEIIKIGKRTFITLDAAKKWRDDLQINQRQAELC